MNPRLERKSELEIIFTNMIGGIAAEAETIEFHGVGSDEMNGGAFRDIVYISPAERTRLVHDYTSKAEAARQIRDLESYRVMMRRAIAVILGGLIDVGVPGYPRHDISFSIRDKTEPAYMDCVRAAAEIVGIDPESGAEIVKNELRGGAEMPPIIIGGPDGGGY